MALASNTVWEVRTAGADTNGGGFVTGAAGTDYSQQDTPNTVGSDISTTDGVGNGTTTFTSATGNFGTTIVGNIIRLNGGTGGLAAGWYQVTARASTTSITLDRTVAAGTGITMTIGGALGSPGMVGGVGLVSNNRIFIKAGTYTVTSATPNISGGCFSPGALLLYVEGYETTRGDLGVKPIIIADGVITTFTLFTLSSNFIKLMNIELDGNNRTSSRGVALGASSLYRIVGRNFTNSAFVGLSSSSLLIECLATGCSTLSAFVNCNCYSCIATANTFTGFIVGNTFYTVNCISYGNTGGTTDGFLTSATNPGSFINCVAYGNGRDGFRLTSAHCVAVNCIAESNTGTGFNSTGSISQLRNCAAYLNTAGNVVITGTFAANYDFVTGIGSFFTNAAAGDFTLNNTTGGGEDVRGVGLPGPFPLGLTVGYIDIGAAQHADPPVVPGGSGNEVGMAF